MKQEEQKYFTFVDVINTVLMKPEVQKDKSDGPQENEISLNVISDFTYLNIWNAFTKWCTDQTELGFLVEIYQFCEMFYISNKPLDGIILKLSNYFIKENEITWDAEKSKYDYHYKIKFDLNDPQIKKLNYIIIAKNLNSKKILVQNGLNNIFKAIGYILKNNPNCQIDLGVLGSLMSSNSKVAQFPSKLKNDTISNKKTTVKALIGRALRNKTLNINTNGNIIQTSNQSEYISNKIPNVNKEERKEKFGIGGIKLPMIKKKIIPNKLNKKRTIESGKERSVISIPIPMPEKNWALKTMFNRTFRKIDVPKEKTNPILFNVYSHTRAAPFTAEKMQIPIAHRIGSFYSLPLQSFIIDKSTKNIKRLYDEYFSKYKNIKFDEPATELEEYLYILKCHKIDETKIQLKKDTYKRYQDFINNSITESYIAEMKSDWIAQIAKLSYRPYKIADYKTLFSQCINEITNGYKISMKTSIIDYILKHPEQREKLNIPTQFRKIKEYAEEKISRPSDGDTEWKASWNRNKLTISNNLFIMCENVTKILKYFTKNLKDNSYVDLKTKDESWPTLKLTNFAESQKAKLSEQEEIINEQWKKYVENILKENKIYKDQLILYFKSVSGLMSCQLRKLIIDSIRKYYLYIKQYKKEKYYTAEEIFSNQFDPKYPFQKSFIEVDIKEHPNGEKFTFSDELNEIHNQLTNVVNNIIKCSQNVERPDNMFIKNSDKHSNLWQVPLNDSAVSKMYQEIDAIITENLEIINKVTDLYQPFEFVMKESDEIKNFLKNNPTRDHYRKKISFYENKLKQLEDMPNNLFMNLIKINCSEINFLIRTKLNDFINELLKNIETTNILGKSKILIEECERLFAQLEIQPSDEKTLYDRENSLEISKTETIPHLFTEYDDFLDWLFFYLSYDTYNVFEPVKENNIFEQSIKNCHDSFNRIEKSVKSYTDDLENAKKKFTSALDQDRSKLFEEITFLKERVEDYKTNIKSKLRAGDDATYAFLSEIEKLNEKAVECKKRLEIINEKEVYLGNPFTTEDERIDQCLFDLAPIIEYFNFLNKFKSIKKDIYIERIHGIKFEDIDELIGKYDIFDISSGKIAAYKDRIIRAKGEFDEFRNDIENARMIFPFIEILRDANNVEDEVLLDHGFYCPDAAKLIFANIDQIDLSDIHQIQEKFLNFILKEVQTNRNQIENCKNEIEKLVTEWQNVFYMHKIKNKISLEINREFVLEKYNNQFFNIIKHENIEALVELLSKNLNIVEEKLNLFDAHANEIIVVKTFKVYKTEIGGLLEVLKKLKDKQYLLESYMERNAELKKNPESFKLLKEAEKEYKQIIEMIKEEEFSIQIVITKKDQFNTKLETLGKILNDIEMSISAG